MEIKITRKSIYEVLKQCPKKRIADFEFLEDHFQNITKCPKNQQGLLKHALKTFKFQFKQKWRLANNKEDRFFRKNEQWLNTATALPTWTLKRPGRPSKDFNESSEQT